MNNELMHRRLGEHPLVQRLMKNPIWKPAAEAAIAELVDGKKCPVPSWKKSSTWTQVQLAVREIATDDSSRERAEE
jgi:hypothetical protein